jgi:hypothetical protein
MKFRFLLWDMQSDTIKMTHLLKWGYGKYKRGCLAILRQSGRSGDRISGAGGGGARLSAHVQTDPGAHPAYSGYQVILGSYQRFPGTRCLSLQCGTEWSFSYVNYHFMSSNFFPPDNFAFYGMMWGKYGRAGETTWLCGTCALRAG